MTANVAGGSDADGTESAGALAQGAFRTLARAADDMAAVFADETPELSSLLVTWALQVSKALHTSLQGHKAQAVQAVSPYACCPMAAW